MGGTALLIEDDEALVASAKRLVADHGLDLESAATWDEGLARFHAFAPSLVIADYNLPGSRHGLRLLLEIAKLRPSVRLVLVSAYLGEEDVERIRGLGVVNEVFRKLNPTDTARAILEEVQRASDAADEPTDWVAFADAAVRAEIISDSVLAAMDAAMLARASEKRR